MDAEVSKTPSTALECLSTSDSQPHRQRRTQPSQQSRERSINCRQPAGEEVPAAPRNISQGRGQGDSFIRGAELPETPMGKSNSKSVTTRNRHR